MSFLQRKIFDTTPPPFGLDVSDLSLKLLWLARDGDCDHVASFGSVPVPQGAIVDGEILDEDVVIGCIRDLVRASGPKRIGTRRVICSLPETKAFLRIIALPRMGKAEAREAVKWEIEANIPLSLDQVYYDWQILPETFCAEKGKMSVLVVAVARSAAEQFYAVLERAGLEPVGLETESIAQVRSLLSEERGDETVLIVDIGDRRTSFVMAIGNVPVFTSSVPLSSQMMTDAISKKMGLSFAEAEKLKIHSGLGSLSMPSPQLAAVKPILDSLASEIERSLDFYFSSLRYSKKLEAVMFCGGGANTQGLLPYFSRRLRQNVVFGDPWVNVSLGKTVPPIDRNRSVQYSTVIGLALRGLDEYEGIA
ncbi:MAG: type IV pilus assembly protein PilM [Candidatus Moranbacteria bacterium]|nr:type IV pilus assembly protein PilM [Candidatus Moranbacteria bacterium]NTW46313.1 type IV pilus assembly protein PilM [Candidatus Moranbacteria bacterium]